MSNKSFKDSQEAAFRRIMREAIRKGPFTKSERDITLAVINHWFHHKGGSKPFIHPSRESIATKAGVSIKTVSRALDMLRTIGVLVPVSGLGGGKAKATRYEVSILHLMTYCGCDWVDEFMRGYYRNVPLNDTKMSRYRLNDSGSKCPTVLYDVEYDENEGKIEVQKPVGVDLEVSPKGFPSQGKKSVLVGFGSLPFDVGSYVDGEDPNENSNLGLGFFDGEDHE